MMDRPSPVANPTDHTDPHQALGRGKGHADLAGEGLTVAIINVRELPPRLSDSSQVNTESRYGGRTCFVFLSTWGKTETRNCWSWARHSFVGVPRPISGIPFRFVVGGCALETLLGNGSGSVFVTGLFAGRAKDVPNPDPGHHNLDRV